MSSQSKRIPDEKAGIYIHVPFCRRRCFYCHFVTVPFEANTIDRYVDALIKEIRLKSDRGRIIDTIYLGGGSPSLLGKHHIFPIFEALNTGFKIDPATEISLECNPEDLSGEKINLYQKAGINRLSIGVQSFQGRDLGYLKRTHTARRSLNAIGDALSAGITNINVDLIIGLPTQDVKSLNENFAYVKRFKIPHVSCYLLENVARKNVSENLERELYDGTRQWFQTGGYLHYEVSNFSLPNMNCRHNLKYWKNQDYLGIGLSAAGYENGIDYKNASRLDQYFRALNKGRLPGRRQKPIPAATRKIVTGLRLMGGIPRSDFCGKENELEMLLANRFLVQKQDRIAVHPERILLLNEILSYFI